MCPWSQQPTTNALVPDLTHLCLCISGKSVGCASCVVICTSIHFSCTASEATCAHKRRPGSSRKQCGSATTKLLSLMLPMVFSHSAERPRKTVIHTPTASQMAWLLYDKLHPSLSPAPQNHRNFVSGQHLNYLIPIGGIVSFCRLLLSQGAFCCAALVGKPKLLRV